ncbi:MAG TPA: ABC transporter permease [Patescibacteria group bacterium]|nr:ABC transporter permease [Patescibacteria group bacterium]
MGPLLRRYRFLVPYLLLGPGLAWLAVYYVYPAFQMFIASFWSGSLSQGFTFSFANWTTYTDALDRFSEQFIRSVVYAGLATLLTFAIAFPLAYAIAFRGGRFKNLLLFLVIAPFFTSFLLRVISWRTILGDDGLLLGPLKNLGALPEDFRVLATPVAVVTGIAYNFLPFMTLPIYVSLEKIDRRLLEAGQDLFATPFMTFRKVTFPLALPGIFAGTLLTFIPAMGDFVNAELLGQTPGTRMIGNVIQNRFLVNNDYPTAAALSFILMAGILVAVAVYARLLGTEELTSGSR